MEQRRIVDGIDYLIKVLTLFVIFAVGYKLDKSINELTDAVNHQTQEMMQSWK